MINYLNNIAPYWASEHLHWIMHTKKQHGLIDTVDEILNSPNDYKLVICPDSSTNDVEQCWRLNERDIEVIILDHHIIERPNIYATVINSADGFYPNNQLCGGGVVYQFCRYLDYLRSVDEADHYLDLVALSLTADMMSLLSLETKHLINKGFLPENIHNPFIYEMWEKNKFKLGEHITSWGAAFYIAPFVNAIVRSGTQEEKEIVFKSMLESEAFCSVASTKRGHKGEVEQLVQQAMRVCTNVKNRQTKAVEEAEARLKARIEEQNLLDNKVLLLLIEPNEIDSGITGLVANRLMAKYQRPCCILTKTIKDSFDAFGDRCLEIYYQGSARGCDMVDVRNFKEVCNDTDEVEFTVGHASAFGISIRESNINAFVNKTNTALKNMPTEPCYYVDYLYNGDNVNSQHIIDIAEMDNLWGSGMPESKVGIKGLKVTKDMVTLMSADKNPTLKITLPNKVAIIKFGSNQKEYEELLSIGYVEINIVGKCAKNEWMGHITPQILVEDMEIVDKVNYWF